jgi:hypothetical protein
MSCFDDNEVDWDGCTEGDLTEFLVTDTTANAQTAPAVAGQSNGDFVAVWVSEGEDGSGAGVYGRVFPSDGGVPGDVFAANQVTNGAQDAPALATLADDSIVVVWESMGQDGFLDGIFGRIFTLDGTPAGDEFQVNLFTNFSQSYPVVTGLPGGSFVVSWQSESQDGSETGVMARHFAADGTPDVAEFAVNTFLLSSQGGPALVRFTDGSLFAAWHSMQQDGNGWGIYGQHFSTGLEKTGIEFCVNSTTTGHQAWPSVALTGEDSFVVAWEGPGQNGDESDVMGQRFGPFNKLGDEFLLPQVKTGTQTSVALASAAAGFAAVWQSCPSLGSQVPGEDGDDCGVFVRFFKTDGVSKTGSIGANLFTTGTQRGPAVATLPDKRVVMVWESCPPVVSPDSGQDGDGCGVYARRFAASGELIYR